MKKIFISILVFGIITISAYADNRQDAMTFFNRYVNAANTYSPTVTEMYSPSAKIIRQVVKPDGTTVDVLTNTNTYITQMKIGQAGAKLRQYKNNYSNITISQITPNKFKISALRQPTGETYKLKTYQIVEKQPNGKWIIVEEMMQTKQQIFLRYAK